MAKVRADCHIRWAAIVLALCAVFLRGMDCQWTLQDFAQDFCNTVAQNQSVQCTCVDIVVVPGQGSNPLCGYSEALGPGLTLVNTTLTGSSNTPPPNTVTLLRLTCDARHSQSASLDCTQSEANTATATTTTTITVGTGFQVSLNFPVDSGSTTFSFSFEDALTNSQATTVSATSGCGPGGIGQPAGTCQVYTESCLSYTVPGGTSFTYDAVVSGGVQMSFDTPIDAQGAIGQGGDGSTHYYWYFLINEIVSYAQSVNIPNANQFSSNYPVTFQGSGVLSGEFLDVYTDCNTSACS